MAIALDPCCVFCVALMVTLLTPTLGGHGSVTYKIEAEDFVTDRFPLHRSNASGEESVNFNMGQTLNMFFCLRRETEVAIDNVTYSNDGPNDAFSVILDGVVLGNITSPIHSEFGSKWNSFMSSGRIGRTFKLSSGRHIITLNFTETDFFGVEIDYIEVNVEDPFLEKELFECSLYCLEGSLSDNGPARDDLPTAKLEQRSFITRCAETQNIVMPFFHDTVRHYLISASMPKYRSFQNNREPDYAHCRSHKNDIWEFENFKIPLENYLVTDNALLNYKGLNLSRTMIVVVKFKMNKLADGTSDTGAGSVLRLHLWDLTEPVSIHMRYQEKAGMWSAPNYMFFRPGELEQVWAIPEDTWSNTSVNNISLTIVLNPDTPSSIHVKYLGLYQQDVEQHREYVIYNSRDITIEAVEHDFGNVRVHFMDLKRLDTEEQWKAVDYIKIRHNLPWSSEGAEVLRLYQSGELQVLPMSPHGLDWIPVGSSVIIGQPVNPNGTSFRAPISRIDIDAGALQFYLKYEDGSTATLLLKTTLYETKVIVKDCIFANDLKQFPFAAFSSMWVYDGNSQVDHVSANGDVEHHIFSGWNSLYGTTFSFFRKCISKYKTQSPDLKLSILNTRDLYTVFK